MNWKKKVVQKFNSWTSLKIDIEIDDNPDFYFHEREIWWASLGANIGYEQDGKNESFERPILILKKFNRYVLWILPLTSAIKESKYYFKTTYRGKEYSIILSQMRLISSKRLLRKIRILPKSEFEAVREAVKGFLQKTIPRP